MLNDAFRKLAKRADSLNSRHRARGRLPPLVLLTDADRMPEPERAVARLPPGSLVILRQRTAAARAALGRRLAPLCRRRRLRLLVAADWRLAWRLRADGVHLPERDAGFGWRRRRGWLVTAAAHSEAALVAACRRGADAALLSPVFPTASHAARPALGPWRFARLAHRGRLPVYALGGIDAASGRRLQGSGAAGIAGIGLFIPPR